MGGGGVRGPVDEALPEARVRRLLLEIGRNLHRYGTPAHRLESALEQVAARLGLEARFFVVPTALFAAFGPLGEQRSEMVRVEPGGVDLGRLARLDDVVKALVAGERSVESALNQVEAIEHEAPPASVASTAVAFGIASGAAAVFFSGGLREVAASLGLGLVMGLMAGGLGRGRARHLVVPLSATVAAALARFSTDPLGPFLFDVVVAAGLLIHLPGLTLTTALAELSTRNLVAGTARLTVAGLILLELGFGLVIGERFGAWGAAALLGSGDVVPAGVASPLPGSATVMALLCAALSFVGIFRIRGADAPAVVASTALAFVGARVGVAAFGPFIGAFFAALTVTLACNGYARWVDRPATVPLVPAILLLVPGAVGLKSMRLALQHAPSAALEAVMEMMLVGLALAVGLVAANVLLVPRRDL